MYNKTKNLFKGILFALAFVTFATASLMMTNGGKTARAAFDPTTISAQSVVGWWGNSTSTKVDDGVKMTIDGDTTGNAWQYGAEINFDGAMNSEFDVSNDKTVTFKFKLGLNDASVKSNNTNDDNGYVFDLIVYNQNDTALMRARYWYGAGGLDLGNHPIDLYAKDTWDTHYATGKWVYGDASLSSEYTIAFNTTDLLMMPISDGSGNMEPRKLDNGTIGSAITTELAATTAVSFQIKGNNGFTGDVDVIVTEINGTSLAATSAEVTNPSDFVTGAGFTANVASNAQISYVDNGVKITKAGNDTDYVIGKGNVFDADDGRSVSVLLPKNATNGNLNTVLTNGRLEFILYNPTTYSASANPGGSLESGKIKFNFITIIVWTNSGGNEDRNTEVRLTLTDSTETIAESTGWFGQIIDNQNVFTFSYDATDGLCGVDKNGDSKALASENNAQKVAELLDSAKYAWGTDKLSMAIGLSTFESSINLEAIVTAVDGVSLANTAGTFTKMKDATIAVGADIPTITEINKDTFIDVYGFDLYGTAQAAVTVTDPNGTSNTYQNANGYNFRPNAIGTWKLKFAISGANGKEVKSEEFSILVKDVYEEINIVLNGSYALKYNLNDNITIIGYQPDSKIASMKIEVLLGTNVIAEVTAGQVYKVVNSGVISIRYTAKDNAQPVANEFVKTCTFNVGDADAPVVQVGNTNTTGKTGTAVTIGAITVTDTSNYVVTVKFYKPGEDVTNKAHGTRITANNSGKYVFTPTEAGEYKIVIMVVDDFDNVTTETLTYTATGASTGGGSTGGGTPSNPGGTTGGGSTGGSTNNQPSNARPLDGGFVIYMCILAAVVAVLAGFSVWGILRKKRGKKND